MLGFEGSGVHDMKEGHRHESQKRHNRVASWQQWSFPVVLQHLNPATQVHLMWFITEYSTCPSRRRISAIFITYKLVQG